MRQPGIKVPLRDKTTGELVDALLFEAIDEEDLKSVEDHWLPAMSQGLERLAAARKPRIEWPQSRHWNWRKKVDRVRNILAYRGFSIVCEDQVQGLMLVTT